MVNRAFILNLLFFVLGTSWSSFSFAQNLKGLPSIPKGGMGVQGSVGAGVADFRTLAHATDYKLDRGTYFTTSIERGFDVMNLFLTFGLSYMDAKGVANYNYTTLTAAGTYTLDEVGFRSKTYELNLGLKLKLINDYWFRPYVEGGGIGNYNDVQYDSKIRTLETTGTDYKKSEAMMGSGYYYEGGFEIQFAEAFGIKLAARSSTTQSKNMETQGNRVIRVESQIFYLAALFGF